ncbi:unnamed protein product [Discula destructiva]
MVSQPDHSSLSGGSGVSSGSTTLLTLRGAAKSVIGTASTSGHHRHRAGRHRDRENHRHYSARSYAGGASAYVPQNEFPCFSQSGDVEIVVKVPSGHENRYLLHRHTLTRCSGFFEASTSDPWSKAVDIVEPRNALAAGNEVAKIGDDREDGSAGVRRIGTPRKRWRYELDCGAGGDDIPMLVQKEESRPGITSTQSAMASLSSPTSIFGGGGGGGGGGSTTSSTVSASGRKHSHSQSQSRDFFRSVANLPLSSSSTSSGTSAYPPPPAADLPPPTQDEQDILRDYDNLFRVMYNFSPVLDGINIADAYVQCKSLLTLADQYDALAVVGPRVDHHLLQFQSRLWKQIAKYPISYLRLGYLARSRIIFQEALIHVVGQWPAGERSLRASLPAAVLDLIEDKVDELEESVARVEGRLFRINLTTRGGERVTPATSYLDWLAVSLFRQWLADNTTPAPPPPVAIPPRNSRHRSSADPSSSASYANAGALVPTSTALATTSNNNNNNNNNNNIPSIPPLSSLGRTYRTLGSAAPAAGGGGQALFLGHDECKRFLKLTPEMYSRENLRRFEKRIDELKALAREVVRPIMGSSLELDLTGVRGGPVGGIGYLTCTRVAERDLPW